MLEILITASITTAFVAGIAALFAPCCITVLLPAYLGSIFRQKRTVFLMTFVFFLGLLSVFLPLGLGVAAFSRILSRYHDLIFTIGGFFLAALGSSILLGARFSLPFHPNFNVKVTGGVSVFALGVFSGFATLCCAPVLAGVLALSALPGSIFWGGVYSLSYVLGIVSPLFFISWFVDSSNVSSKLGIFRKRLSYSIANKRIDISAADALSGTVFIAMSLVILYLSSTGQIAMKSGYQTSMNIYMDSVRQNIASLLPNVDPVVLIAVLSVIVVAIIAVVSKKIGDSKSALEMDGDDVG
ncbi:MAG: hypothetical protein HZB68_00505 [Candidatus Aenigmarchaeota archaeon]|nr:hypothetical protein [Candidatus Aenigmarchaeota archaeon]